MFENIVLLSDSYKVSHYRQYPPDTKTVYSYFESRYGSKYSETVFFGLQYFLKRYLNGRVVTQEKIDEADELYKQHFGNSKLFNRAGWEYILKVHAGKLPVSIKAVPEGTVVPESNVLMTVENTDPKCYWLTNYLETLLVQVWYPCTVATQSREMKKVIMKYLRKTGDPSLIDFKLHDFGFRGSTSVESAALGGAAHLVNFKGTDTVPPLILAKKVYNEDMAGFSIPAAEHSTITAWGRDNEVRAFDNMLEVFKEFPLVAVVSDSYDIHHATKELWGKTLRAKVLERQGTLVVRPDSGYPPKEVPSVIHDLEGAFGYSVNEKGYKVLDPHVRVIQGDGIDYEMLEPILSAMEQQGQSADNIAFGSGGGLLQKLNRDTLRFAFKASAINIGGEWFDVYKEPKTDPTKGSKRGRLKLVRVSDGVFKTVPQMSNRMPDELLEVFRNGSLLRSYTLNEIRKRASLEGNGT